MSGVRLDEIVLWRRGERALANGIALSAPAPSALSAMQAMEQLGALLAETAPQGERARRLAPNAPTDPVALLAACRSLRFYLPIEPGAPFEVEVTLVPEEGELVVVQAEVRRTGVSGDRVSRGELRYLVVPGSGEHSREARIRDSERLRLGTPPGGW